VFVCVCVCVHIFVYRVKRWRPLRNSDKMLLGIFLRPADHRL